MLGSEADAHDVCHDVFIKLAASWPRIRDREKLSSWLFRTTTNLCIDRLRLRKDVDPAALDRLSAGFPHDHRAQYRQALHNLWEKCPRADRALVILRFLEGLEINEIAEVTGSSPRTLARRLKRIRARAARLGLGELIDSQQGVEP